MRYSRFCHQTVINDVITLMTEITSLPEVSSTPLPVLNLGGVLPEQLECIQQFSYYQ